MNFGTTCWSLLEVTTFDMLCRNYMEAFQRDDSCQKTLFSEYGVTDRLDSSLHFVDHKSKYWTRISEEYNFDSSDDEDLSGNSPLKENVCSVFNVKSPLKSFAQFNGKPQFNKYGSEKHSSTKPEKDAVLSVGYGNKFSYSPDSAVKNMQTSKMNGSEFTVPRTSSSRPSFERDSISNDLPRKKQCSSNSQNSNVSANINCKIEESLKIDYVSEITKAMDRNKDIKFSSFNRKTETDSKTFNFQTNKPKIPPTANLDDKNRKENNKTSLNDSPRNKRSVGKICEFCQTKSPTSKENEFLCDQCVNEKRERDNSLKEKPSTNPPKIVRKSIEGNAKNKRYKRKKDSNMMSRTKKVLSEKELQRLKQVRTQEKGYHHLKILPEDENPAEFADGRPLIRDSKR